MKWNTLLYGLLFSGLGIFSYLLLVNYTELTPKVADVLYSKGAFVFFIAALNVLGYSTLRISSWINNQYALNIRHRWKITATYLVVTLLFLLLNYGLLITAKLLAGLPNLFTFSNGGWRILIVVWLVELVIVGLLLANRSIQNNLKLQQEAAKLQTENDTARYAALQSQLNPHFLFNSLGDCISCNCCIPSGYTGCMLPPLTLQLLAENVINHNSITLSKPMKIEICLEEEYLVVSNPIQPKKSHESPGVGLKNLSNRCLLMLGKEIIIQREEKVFTVKVPLLYE